MSISSSDFFALSPVITLTLTGFVIILLGLVSPKMKRGVFLGITCTGLVVACLFTLRLWNLNSVAFEGMVVSDNFALTFNFIFLISAALSLLLSFSHYDGGYLLYGEFFAITLFATVGMLLMAAGKNLLVLFLGLETLSISLYILAGFKRTEGKSLEAAFKYFLLGAFASSFLLYGVAFVYGMTGSLELDKIANYVAKTSVTQNPLLLLGVFLIFVGLGFKVAIFPFHMWAPDVYEGAPTPITAFMSTGSKAAGFAAMLRLFFSATNGTVSDWTTLLAVLSIITMFVGNIAAIVQTNIKRMLAYSSIAHAGYILIGFVAWNEAGSSAVIFYLLAYTFMNIGAFGVISYFSSKKRELLELSDLKGLAYQKPMACLAMAIFMFSLAGLPPTAGFFGKFYLFAAAVKAGYIPLVIIGVINAMISLYYYLGVVVMMFMKESESRVIQRSFVPTVAISLLLAVFGTVGLGLFPSYWIESFQNFISFMI